jgi:hypothetical protein
MIRHHDESSATFLSDSLPLTSPPSDDQFLASEHSVAREVYPLCLVLPAEVIGPKSREQHVFFSFVQQLLRAAITIYFPV